MAKKEKLGVDKIVKRVNKEFEKTTGQIESLISDALRQLDALQNQIQEPLRKLMDDMERIREREMKRFQEEFDRRMGEFHDLQQTVLEKLGLPGGREKKPSAGDKKPKGASTGAKPVTQPAEKPAAKASPKAKPAAKKSKSAAKPAAKGAATTKSANTVTKAKAAPATKSVTKAKAAPAAKPAKGNKSATGSSTKTTAAKPATATVNKSDLTQIKGIGPATIKKMKDAGINSIDQIANPSADDQKKLDAFSSMKGYETWQTQARKLLG